MYIGEFLQDLAMTRKLGHTHTHTHTHIHTHTDIAMTRT